MELMEIVIPVAFGVLILDLGMIWVNERTKQEVKYMEEQPQPQQPVIQNVPQNPQPQPTAEDIRKVREAGMAGWKAIATDTYQVFDVFIKAGFTRSEALDLTVLFLTGKSRQ